MNKEPHTSQQIGEILEKDKAEKGLSELIENQKQKEQHGRYYRVFADVKIFIRDDEDAKSKIKEFKRKYRYKYLIFNKSWKETGM